MNARAISRRSEGTRGRFDIARHAAGEADDGSLLDFRGDGVDGFEVAVRDAGKARLDGVDP